MPAAFSFFRSTLQDELPENCIRDPIGHSQGGCLFLVIDFDFQLKVPVDHADDPQLGEGKVSNSPALARSAPMVRCFLMSEAYRSLA